MSEQNKCPKCGARWTHNDLQGRSYFECQSSLGWADHNGIRSIYEADKCLRNQLAQSQAEGERLREKYGNLAFAVRRLFEHERDFINDEKYCRFCEMTWDTYVCDTFPHLNTCAFRDIEKALAALEATE